MAVLVAAAGYVLAYALTPLLLVLPHELGHGLAALVCGARPVSVVVGAEPRRIGLHAGALDIRLRPLNRFRWLWYGTARWDGSDASRAQQVLCAAAGPLTTLVIVLAYSAAGTATAGVFRWSFGFLALGGAWTFLTTALPIRYGRLFGPYAGRTSDGYQIREILTS